jgi:hypothetical protein
VSCWHELRQVKLEPQANEIDSRNIVAIESARRVHDTVKADQQESRADQQDGAEADFRGDQCGANPASTPRIGPQRMLLNANFLEAF